MADGAPPGAERRRPHQSPGQLAASFLQFDLASEIDQLRREPGAKAGQNAKTLVKHDDFRVVLITLEPDTRIPSHHTAGRISISTISGHVRVHAEGRTFDMPAGSLLALDRSLPHEVEALTPSAVLLTIAWGEEALDTRDALGGRA